MELRYNSLYVKHDLCNVFSDARNSGKLMKYSVKLDACYGYSGKRAEQYSAKRVTECSSVASFKRFYYKLSERTVLT